MGNRTPLYQEHQTAGAKIVDFAGWDMPLHYGSQLEEHHFVRKDAGMFDVSHMTIVDVKGTGACDYLRYLLANDVAKIKLGKALYSCMLNDKGGVVDDLIVYFLGPEYYRLVVNSSTREKDIAWLQTHCKDFKVTLDPRFDLAIIAVQGPHALEKISKVLNASQVSAIKVLQPFECVELGDTVIARTGYTGEEGVEMMLPASTATHLWQALLKVNVHPCGLGARDTLRLEAGMSLYGSDMDETTTPLESNLSWTVTWEPVERHFVGRKALESQKQQGVPRRLVGIVLEERGVLRPHQKIMLDGAKEGEITSGTFSPTLNHAVALARIPAGNETICSVDIRGKQIPVRIVKPPFVRNGKKVFS
jgi:aminomethyltransferase